MEDGPHTGAMKGSIIYRARNYFMVFVAAEADAGLGRREAVFAVGRTRLLETPANSWLCVIALRVLRLRRLWMRLIHISWRCG